MEPYRDKIKLLVLFIDVDTPLLSIFTHSVSSMESVSWIMYVLLRDFWYHANLIKYSIRTDKNK